MSSTVRIFAVVLFWLSLPAWAAKAGQFDGEWQGIGGPTPQCPQPAEIAFTLNDDRIVRSFITGPKGRGGLTGLVDTAGMMNVTSGPFKGQFHLSGDKFDGTIDTFCGNRRVTGERAR